MIFSTFTHTAGRLVASAIVKGTSRMRASVCARSVFPDPVGPMRDVAFLHPPRPHGGPLNTFVVVIHGDREDLWPWSATI